MPKHVGVGNYELSSVLISVLRYFNMCFLLFKIWILKDGFYFFCIVYIFVTHEVCRKCNETGVLILFINN